MGINDLLRIVRTRWLAVCITTLVTVVGAITYTLLQTPLYEASTRLFVAAVGGQSVSESLNGNRLSQERVLSYTQLIIGDTLAQRTIDRLNLDMDSSTLKEKVTAKSKPNTVLIDVSVQDESPVRARDIANALSDEFVVMARELETSSPGARPDARVVVEQRASLPDAPVVPKKARNLALGIVLGGTFGIGLAVARDHFDNTLKDRKALEEVAGVGVVGSTPVDKNLRTNHVISLDTGHSASAEAFRKLRTNLQFLAVDRPPRVIVITSSSPNEGKSTTAVNLALVLAEADHNVVLIDGDMRRPSLHKYLDLIGTAGFSNVLSGSVPLPEALQATRYPRLTILTAGTTPPNPSELLGSLAAKTVLGDLRDRFDYVIVDSAPLLAVTDSALLAANADGTLVAVRFGHTKREELAHAIKNLEDVGAEILGTISTMEPVGKSSGYYYSYYGYGEGTSKKQSTNSPANSDGATNFRVPKSEPAVSDEHVKRPETTDK